MKATIPGVGLYGIIFAIADGHDMVFVDKLTTEVFKVDLFFPLAVIDVVLYPEGMVGWKETAEETVWMTSIKKKLKK